MHGLSVLIPIYQQNIETLVLSLWTVLIKKDEPFEIRIYEDGSNSIQHFSQIQNLAHVVIKVLPANIGRSKIRNLLAEEAQYESLLFLDGDMLLEPSANVYIDNWLIFLHLLNKEEDHKVYSGGHHYQSKKPAIGKRLHWTYGKNRECLSIEQKNKHPFQSFSINNTLISKKLFLQIKFDETLSGYGHEDTLFGIALEKTGMRLEHIPNSTLHTGIEDDTVFLAKSKEAMLNLYQLYTSKSVSKHSINLLRYTGYMPNLSIFFWRKICSFCHQKLLNKSNPHLLYFDFWKMAQWKLCIHKGA